MLFASNFLLLGLFQIYQKPHNAPIITTETIGPIKAMMNLRPIGKNPTITAPKTISAIVYSAHPKPH